MQQRHFRTALVAVNAQFIHTGLGVRSIAAYARQKTDEVIDWLEFTINQPEQEVLSALYECRADAYLFSCYIWNIEWILRLTRNLRQVRPEARIGLGGPQVSHQAATLLNAEPQIDFIVVGEGEETVCQLVSLLKAEASLEACQGLAYREGERIICTAARPPLSLDELAFAYPDLDALPNRILYYESMRGCPFSCSYCSSSMEQGVRVRSLPLVFADLSVFLAHRVPQVKFVDRTFNCDKNHALAIWKWLADHDNGVSNFHFELSGELLDEEMLTFLAGVRPQLFQFEIGVQSTNPETLRKIDRPANLARLFSRVNRVLEPGNIHVHLDLIAGLPYEGYASFQASFNEVYACRPHQFQLGFLKVLSGSKMQRRAQSYGLLYADHSPYEVLATRWISYPQLVLLHGVTAMVNLYYNSFRFQHILAHLVPLFPDPFSFYLTLWLHYQQATEGRPLSDMGQYSMLESFVRSQGFDVTDHMRWLAKYDLLLHEKPRKLPPWVTVDLSPAHREAIRGFFMQPGNIGMYLPEYAAESSVRVERMAHLEIFPFNPETNAEGEIAILFNYRRRNLVGIAHTTVLPLHSILHPEATR